MVLAKWVMMYVAGTAYRNIFYPKSSVNCAPLTAYADDNWAGWNETRRSTTVILITPNGTPVLWTSKRQAMIALNSFEAEYIAISTCGKDIMHLRRPFIEYKLNKPIAGVEIPPPELHTDITSAISLIKTQKRTQQNKYIYIIAHHIKQLVQSRTVIIRHINTHKQPADLLKKTLPRFVMDRLLPYYNM